MTKAKPKKGKGRTGRPEKMTEAIRSKIDESASLGASINEIAFYADIHRTTLYRWMKEDGDLKDRIEALQQNPIMQARRTVVLSMTTNPELALKFLERKLKSEFSLRIENANSDPQTFKRLDEEQRKEVRRAFTLGGLNKLLKDENKKSKEPTT